MESRPAGLRRSGAEAESPAHEPTQSRTYVHDASPPKSWLAPPTQLLRRTWLFHTLWWLCRTTRG